jgi:hypothetical protein
VARKERELPALPASAATLAEGGRPDVELTGWLHALLTRAEQGDEQAGKAVLQACREVPKLWELLSVLAGHAEQAWVDLLAAGSGILARRTIEQDLKRKRAELAGEGASPLEALLIERVVLCWLAAQQADAQYARKLKDGMSFREGEYYARRCEQASRQLLRSVEALARVRRLLGPSLQINIAEKQINVAP